MTRTTVAVSGPPLDDETTRSIEDLGQAITYVTVDDGVFDVLDGCWAHILGGAEVLDAAAVRRLPPSVEVVCFVGTGYESYMDVQALGERGITACFTPHANATATAEFALTLLLMGLRQVPQGVSQVSRSEWSPLEGRSLRTSSIGVVGFGHVGRALVEMLVGGFGARPLVWNRTPRHDDIRAAGGEPATLEEIFGSCAGVSLHANQGPDRAALIGPDLLSLVRRDLVLVNTARGGVVDPVALWDVLEREPGVRVLADVYPEEPASAQDDRHGLLRLGVERFLLTPHMAYSSDDSAREMGRMIVGNLEAFLRKTALPYPVAEVVQ